MLIASLGILASLVLTACEQHVRTDGTWQKNIAHDRSFNRLLVVGISPDVNIRCDFEHFLKTQLSDTATTAITSCSAMSINEPLSIEGIDAAVIEKQADAVLATILVASKIGAETGGNNETRGDAYYKATGTGYANYYYGGFGRYGVPVTYVEFQTAPPITTVDGAVEIITRLFDVSDGEMVYEIITAADDLQSRDSAFATVTAPIAEQLRRDGLIK